MANMPSMVFRAIDFREAREGPLPSLLSATPRTLVRIWVMSASSMMAFLSTSYTLKMNVAFFSRLVPREDLDVFYEAFQADPISVHIDEL